MSLELILRKVPKCWRIHKTASEGAGAVMKSFEVMRSVFGQTIRIIF